MTNELIADGIYRVSGMETSLKNGAWVSDAGTYLVTDQTKLADIPEARPGDIAFTAGYGHIWQLDVDSTTWVELPKTAAGTAASQAAASATAAAGSASAAAASASQAQTVAASIPADYTELSNSVVDLKSALNTTLAWHYAEIGAFSGTSFNNYTTRARVHLNSLPKYKTVEFHYPSTLTFHSFYKNVGGTWSAVSLGQITNNRYTFAADVDQMVINFKNKNDDTADITQAELAQTYVSPIDAETETAIDIINEDLAETHGDIDNLSELIDDLNDVFNTAQAVSTLNGNIVQIHLPGIKNQIRRLVLNQGTTGYDKYTKLESTGSYTYIPTYSDVENGVYCYRANGIDNLVNYPEMVSTQFKTDQYSNFFSNKTVWTFTMTTSGIFMITPFATLENFKAYISRHPIYVWWKTDNYDPTAEQYYAATLTDEFGVVRGAGVITKIPALSANGWVDVVTGENSSNTAGVEAVNEFGDLKGFVSTNDGYGYPGIIRKIETAQSETWINDECTDADNKNLMMTGGWFGENVDIDDDGEKITVTAKKSATNLYARKYIDVRNLDRITISMNEVAGYEMDYGNYNVPYLRIGKFEHGSNVFVWLESSDQYDANTRNDYIISRGGVVTCDCSTWDYAVIGLYISSSTAVPVGTAYTFRNVMVQEGEIGTGYTKSELTAVDNRLRDVMFVKDPPDYYLSNGYLDNKVRRINELCRESAGNGDAFVFLTDTHWCMNQKHSPELIRYIYNRTHIDKLFHGGDISNGGMFHPDWTYDDVAVMLRKAFPGKIYYAMGNHEYLSTYDDNYMASIFNADGEKFGNPGRNYYYINNMYQKIRYVFLNAYAPSQTSGQTASSGYEADQITWLINEALDVETGWSIVIVTHHLYSARPVYNDEVITNTDEVWTPFTSVINALDNYSGNGKILFVIQGHTHYDKITSTPGGIPVMITTCDKNVYGTTLDMPRQTVTSETIDEQAFDVCIIDKAGKKMTAVRIGRQAQNGVDTSPGILAEERIITWD